MIYIFIVYAFVMGAVLSSFITLVGYRVPKGMSIVSPGSRCSSCGEGLKSLDLIPIVSYLVSRGKCRYCGSEYGSFHMWLELLAGMSFGLVTYLYWGDLVMIQGLLMMVVVVNINIVTRKIYGVYLRGVNLGMILPMIIFMFLQGKYGVMVLFVLVGMLVMFDKGKRRKV